MFWPGEFHGLYSPWGRKKSDMIEQLSLTSHWMGFTCHGFHHWPVFSKYFLIWVLYCGTFSGGSDGKNSPTNARNLGSVPWLGRFPAEWHGNPLQYPWTEEPGRLQTMRSQRVGHNWVTNTHCGGGHGGRDLIFVKHRAKHNAMFIHIISYVLDGHFIKWLFLFPSDKEIST